MIFSKFACRSGLHKWMFDGRAHTSFCIACGKTKSGPRHAATKAVSA